MSLRLTLKPNERVIINGCVLKNGPRRHLIEVENRADILRGEDMLSAETAETPVRRLAYHIQIALVSRSHRAEYDLLITEGMAQLIQALPRFAAEIAEAEAQLQAKDYYNAFRALKPLIAHEDLIFAQLRQESA